MNGKSISEGIKIATIVINKANNLPEPQPDANYSFDQDSFAKYVLNINNPLVRASTVKEWFSRNDKGYGDALRLTAICFNNLS